MHESEDQNSKSKKNSDVTLQDGHVAKSNEYCSVPILQKVLVPYPGHTTRLYSVQVMRCSEANDFYPNVWEKCQQDPKNVTTLNERERSPRRDPKDEANDKYWNSSDFKEFKQYKA